MWKLLTQSVRPTQREQTIGTSPKASTTSVTASSTPVDALSSKPLGTLSKSSTISVVAGTSIRQGKAPPVDTFNGDANFEDWPPGMHGRMMRPCCS